LKLCRHYTILKQDMDAFLDRHRAALLDKHRSALTRSAKCQRSSESVDFWTSRGKNGGISIIRRR